MKKRKIFSILFTGFLLLAGCSSSSAVSSDKVAEDPAASETPAVIFTDDLGREVTVKKTERTAVLLGSFADIWCLAGGKDTLKACAGDAWTDFDLQLGEDVINTGSILSPDVEALIGAEPDFILCSSNTKSNLELQDTLEQLGIPFAYFGVNCFDEYLHMLDICTQITGHRENYSIYGLDVEQEIAYAKKKVNGTQPKILLIRAGGKSASIKNSTGTVLGEMLADLGTVNIADSEESLLENLSIEKIMEEDPDYIFAVYQGSDSSASEKTLKEALLDNPAWQTLRAVKNSRYYVMDRELYHLKPNERWGEAYLLLAELLYE